MELKWSEVRRSPANAVPYELEQASRCWLPRGAARRPRDDPYGNRFNECRQCGRFSPTAVATVEGFVDAAVVG